MDHPTRDIRRAVTKRSGRRLVGAMLRGRIGVHPWADDWQNFWNCLTNRRAAHGHCPLCRYRGTFLTFAGRPRQVCPACGSRARHRTLALAVERRLDSGDAFAFETGLHLAPEPCLEALLARHCRNLLTGDLEPGVGRVALDLRDLPFADASFDLVFASHVLEHIVEDRRALEEIHRVLRPEGLAILMVPITADRTIEFGSALADKNHHARECGPDYLERYVEAGFELEVMRSDEFDSYESAALATRIGPTSTVHHIPFCRKPPEKTGQAGP